MRIKKFQEEIEIPEGIEVALEGRTITLKGKEGEVSKEFKMPRLELSKNEKGIIITCENYNVYDKRDVSTVKAHVRNLIKGVTEGYTYKLKICSSHFPMNVAINDNKLVVKNLLGEKVPRELKLKEGAKVEVKGNIIEIVGQNIDIVSKIASDIEQLTRITNRDRRIFQDGIYITHKAGKEI